MLLSQIGRRDIGWRTVFTGPRHTVTVSLPAERCGVHRVQDVPFHYAGGFQPVMMELSDALPYEGYKEKYLD